MCNVLWWLYKLRVNVLILKLAAIARAAAFWNCRVMRANRRSLLPSHNIKRRPPSLGCLPSLLFHACWSVMMWVVVNEVNWVQGKGNDKQKGGRWVVRGACLADWFAFYINGEWLSMSCLLPVVCDWCGGGGSAGLLMMMVSNQRALLTLWWYVCVAADVVEALRVVLKLSWVSVPLLWLRLSILGSVSRASVRRSWVTKNKRITRAVTFCLA